MDKIIAAKLDSKSGMYDASLCTKLAKQTRDYVNAGLQCLNYYVCDLDAANDMVQCWAQVSGDTAKTWDSNQSERNKPERFIHPMAATQMATLATFISQILFGSATSRRVEARRDEEEKSADMMNELLQWNDDQQPTYLQGYLWIWDSLTFNRGVMYDHWQDIAKVELEKVEEEDPYAETPDAVEGQPTPERPKYTRYRKRRKVIAGFNKVELISPYDFISDPMLPHLRFQEGRYAGHRTMIPWQELKRRSELPVEDYMYVTPAVVEKLKNRPTAGGNRITNALSQPMTASRSRSFYERTRRGNPAGYEGGTEAVNKEDGGMIECFCVHIRIPPKSFNLFDDDEPEIIEVLMGGEQEILSVNIMPNVHDEYPYAVGEARPNAHYQFAPSWALIIKPIQDWVDYLKNRHARSIARTSGNIFIADPTKVDIQAFTDPDKDGLIIPLKEEGQGVPIDQIIKQVPVIDTTANFHAQMEMWIQHGEVTTGAHAFVQGQTEDSGQTATQFTGVQQMATGRISSVARILSVSGLVPQTRRFVCNFQQFAPDEMTIRITGNSTDFDADDSQTKFLTIRRDNEAFPPTDPRFAMPDIQAEFDIRPHDGSLPGTDARKVAALSRAIEAFGANPQLATFFDDTVPGNLNAKKIWYEVLKASGMPVRNFVVSAEQAQKNLIAKMQATGTPMMPAGADPNGQGPQSVNVGGGLKIPGAGLPPQSTAAHALPNPASV
jgi:hypothetical protein